MDLSPRRWVPWLLVVTLVSPRVHRAQSQLLDPSQAAVLEECQSEWKVRLSQWSNGGDCSKAEAIQCNEQGMITRMAPQGYMLQGSLPASIGNLVSLSYLYAPLLPVRTSPTCTHLSYLYAPLLPVRASPTCTRLSYLYAPLLPCAAGGPCEVPQVSMSRFCASCTGFCASCTNESATGPSNSPAPTTTTTTKAASARLSQPTCLLPHFLLLLLFISVSITN
ncbi:unnamed protein product [Closterium sp. NIES-53]